MTGELHFTTLTFGSRHQVASLALRDRVLRQPLGLSYQPVELAKEANEVHLAVLNANRVLGILLLKPSGTGVMKMRQVAVETTFQGSGLGSRLVAYCESWCRENQIVRIELHARSTAVDFYKRNGYQIQGEKFSEVGIDHYFMFKNLE